MTSDNGYYGNDVESTHYVCKEKDGTESWKSVQGWPYEVSDLGRVRRIDSRKTLRPKSWNKRVPYKTVLLSDRSRRKTFLVATLVCNAFLGPPPAGYEIHHRDHSKTNNCLENLEYVTAQQNILYSVSNGHRGSNRWNAVLTEAEVRTIREMRHEGITVKEISRFLGIGESAIYHVLRGENWKHVK